MQADFVEGDFELRRVLFYGGCGFTIMRCMSFALENCERKDGNFSILELLKYNFYLPFFYFGPVMTFDKFYVQVGRPGSISHLKSDSTFTNYCLPDLTRKQEKKKPRRESHCALCASAATYRPTSQT